MRVNESYERAYGTMVTVQRISELEEAIQYKLRPERQQEIASMWQNRLQVSTSDSNSDGCRETNDKLV